MAFPNCSLCESKRTIVADSGRIRRPRYDDEGDPKASSCASQGILHAKRGWAYLNRVTSRYASPPDDKVSPPGWKQTAPPTGHEQG